MAVDVEIGEAGSVGCMEQFGGLCEVDQDIGLGRPAPANISTFLSDSLIERRHPAARTLQLSTQCLERRAIVFFSAASRSRLPGERRAGIGGGPLDQSLQWIADVLGCINGGGDEVFGFARECRCSWRALFDAGCAASADR